MVANKLAARLYAQSLVGTSSLLGNESYRKSEAMRNDLSNLRSLYMNEITINGKIYEIPESDLDMSLIDYLRNKLDLTGTKNGCNIGVCGACTVLIDGSSKRSCVVKLNKAIGKEIVTIEGMEAEDGTLHPIQQAFIDAGAIQCGFCTPGMVMSAHSLLLKDNNPTRDQIKKAIAGNLCRCTGYQQIIDAIQNAAMVMREE